MKASIRPLAILGYGLLMLGCGGVEESVSAPEDTSIADIEDVTPETTAADSVAPGDLLDVTTPEGDTAPLPDPPEITPDPPETEPLDILDTVGDLPDVFQDVADITPDGGDGQGDAGDALPDVLDALEDGGDALDVVELPPPPEPVAWYSFEATEGPVLDSSGNELHGTATGWGVVRGEPGVSGGLGVTFDGTGGRILINPNPLFELTDGFTMEAWVKPTALEDQQTVLHMGDAGGNEVSLALLEGEYPVGEGWGPGGRLRVSISSPKPSLNNELTVVHATDIALGPEGQWIHIAVTNDGTSMRLYGNGQLMKEGEPGVYMGGMDQETVRIGGDDYNGQVPNPFVGQVDEVKWWNVSRTPVEICEGIGGLGVGGGVCALPSEP